MKIFIKLILICSLSSISLGFTYQSQLYSDYSNDHLSFNHYSLLNIESEAGLLGYVLKVNVMPQLYSGDIMSKTWTSQDLAFSIYRATITYQTQRTDVQLGMQQINFGVGKILRPLQWFDSIDPFNIYKNSSGINGLTYRHYYINNNIIWGWVLYGNNQERLQDDFQVLKDSVEWGGRFQGQYQNTEYGFSLNRRSINLEGIVSSEYHVGLDYLLSSSVPIWTEHSFTILNSKNNVYKGMLGFDYSLGWLNNIYFLNELFYKKSKIDSSINEEILYVAQTTLATSLYQDISVIALLTNQSKPEYITMINQTYNLFKVVGMLYAVNKKISLAFYWNY